MAIWDKISSLAKDLLGEGQSPKVNFSRISEEVCRPKGIESNLGTRLERKKQEIQDIEVLPEYQFLLKAIEEKCPAIFVTGRAGTGKSTLIRFLISKIKRSAVIAPTAIAAINVGGSTIHSFFGIPHRTINPDESFIPRRHMVPVVENLDVLIIDEVSMVPPDLVDCISNSLIKAREDSSPFGGVPVVFVGDLLQLPPVVADDDVAIYYTHRYESPYFFSAEVFKRVDILPVELRKVFRQKDTQFIEALDRIRTNTAHRDSVALLNRACYRDRQQNDIPSLYLVPTNAAANSINTEKLNTLETKLFTFNAIVEGNLRLGRTRLPAPDPLRLKEGARVIFLKNNKPMWLNGTLGEVLNIQDETIQVKIVETGNIVSVSRESWKKIRYKYNYESRTIESEVTGSFTQFPLSLGWAITIHKSQGMTLNSVRIDLGRGAFCSGQTYVALSRCRSIEGIRLDKPISMSDVKADATIVNFYRKLGFLEEGPDAQQSAGPA